jgi:hypothetical protein
MTAACISALVLASCGNTDSSSNRNGRLNSALCFDTQDEKDAAIADAQKALDEATPPTLEEAEQANNGGRATLAFIGPQLWWMHAASGASTTTTTQPATTTSSTSSTVASSSTSTSSTVASSSTSTSSTVASSSTSTDSTDVATDSTDQSTDTSVPLVGDMVLQQLQDELAAVTNAPLCDSTDSSDTTVDPESSITCTATVRSDGASFDCARPLWVQFFYRTNSGGDGNPVSLVGNEQTTFGPIDDVRDIQLAIASNGVYVFSQPVESGVYDFEVPIAEETSETEPEFGFEDPYFSGVFNPATGEDTVSFTIPNDYSYPSFWLELYAECENQSIEATIYGADGYDNFIDPSEYFPGAFGDGMCGVWLIVDDASFIPRGETFEVVIRTAKTTQIMWQGNVALDGDGVSRDGELTDEQFVWDELFIGEIDADRYMAFEIPEGGRQIDVRAITTRFENQEIYVDPYLEIIFDLGIVADDNGGESYGYGAYSSRLNVFLEEGTYVLRATTYDLWDGFDGWPTTYDLELRMGSLSDPTDEAAPSGDLPEGLQVPVKVLDAPPSSLEEPKPVFPLPVNEVINRDKSSNEPNPVIPAGVTEVVCDSGCLSLLREAAGVSEGVVAIQIGGEVIEVQPEDRRAMIPVRPTAKEIQVTVTPRDGGEAVVLSTEVVVNSPRTFPTKFMEGVESVTKINQRESGIPTYLIVVLVALALAIAIELVRRQKVRLPQ